MAGADSDSSAPSRLTLLQRDLLDGFFAREQRFHLTGGGALAGFYFGHRDTEDLDLFSEPGPDLTDSARVLERWPHVGQQSRAYRPIRTFAGSWSRAVTNAASWTS